MFLEATAFGLILGAVRGGRFSNLSLIKFRGLIFIFLAFVLNIFPIFYDSFPEIKQYENIIYVFSMILLTLGLILNINKKGIWIILLGALLNFVAIYMNGFKMPIYFKGLQLAGLDNMIEAIKSGEIKNYIDLNNAVGWTRYLGKFIVIPKPYPFAKVISTGDVFMSLGIIQFLQGEMNRTYLTMKSRMIRMGYKMKL